MAKCDDRIDYYLGMKDGVKQTQAGIDHMADVARHSYNQHGCNKMKNASAAKRSFTLAKQTQTRPQKEYYRKCVDVIESKGLDLPFELTVNKHDYRSQATRKIRDLIQYMRDNSIDPPEGRENVRCDECKYWSRTYADYGNCKCHHKSRKAEWGCGAGEPKSV